MGNVHVGCKRGRSRRAQPPPPSEAQSTFRAGAPVFVICIVEGQTLTLKSQIPTENCCGAARALPIDEARGRRA